MSFEPIPFRPGRTYVVRQSFVEGDTFEAGERLTFVRCQGHSPYDSSWVYEFRTQLGEEKAWFADEDLDAEGAAQYIALVDWVSQARDLIRIIVGRR